MLSDREQRVLDDIEVRLTLEDPRFVAAMSGHQVPSWRRILAFYFSTVSVLLGVLLTAMAGLYTASVCIASAAGAVMIGYGLAAWRRHRARRH